MIMDPNPKDVEIVRPGYKGEVCRVYFARGYEVMLFDDGQIFRWLKDAKEWEQLNITAG